MQVSAREGQTWPRFWLTTVSAQIHLLGSLAAIFGMIPLIHHASRTGNWADITACIVFGVTGALVFTTSSIYHFLHDGFQISPRLENIFENLDHATIYCFIAGTYTPFLLNTVANPWRTVLMIGVWSLVVIGICLTCFRQYLPKWMQTRAVYTAIFVAMGWTLLLRVGEIFNNISRTQAVLLIGGALAYSIGAVVYATKRPRLFENVFGFHELWHTFVVVGFACHYFLIASFYAV